MTKEEILEGNKLIAEFIGYEKEEWEDEPIRYYINDHIICTTKDINPWESSSEDWNSWLTSEEMLFDSDWNWLMPCVEKINKINILEIPSNLGTLKMKVKGSLYGIGVDNTIEDVWEVVVLFIKTYNEECSE